MRPRRTLAWPLGILLLLLGLPAPAQDPLADPWSFLTQQPGIKLTVVPNPVALCPGEEVTITVKVEIEVVNPATEEKIWMPAPGVPVSLVVTQVGSAGEPLKSAGKDLYKTDAQGSFPVRVRHEANLAFDEYFHFITHAKQKDGKRSHFVRASVQILNLTKEECDKAKDPSPKGGDDSRDWIKKTDEKIEKGVLKEDAPDKVKKHLDELIKHLKEGKTGKHYTVGRVNAAVKELQALQLRKQLRRVAAADLEKTLAARHARFLDLLERLGRFDHYQDPTRTWLTDLKGKSDAELGVLLRQAQAANDILLRQVIVQLGQPPDYRQPIHLFPVLVVKNGDAFEGHMIMHALHARKLKVERVVAYDTDHGRISNLTVLRAPDLIRIELQNRLPKADAARRKDLQKLISEAQKAQSRCVTGGALIESLHTYRQRKEAGNEKGAEEIRRQYLDRFHKQTVEGLK
jgi:hypothetical protein